MTYKIIGYIVGMAPKKTQPADAVCLMSFGKDGEIDPEYLLIRGRAQVFPSVIEATKALEASIKHATELDHSWPKRNRYFIIEVIA